MKNYYEILEVNPRASEEVIKKAHQVLIKKYHPDLYVGVEREKAEEKIRNINEAYKILSDGFLREQYDKELQKEEDIYNQRVYKQKEKNTNYKADTKKKNRKEDYDQEQMPTHNVGTFMSLVDLVSVTFKNMPKREKRKRAKEQTTENIDFDVASMRKKKITKRGFYCRWINYTNCRNINCCIMVYSSNKWFCEKFITFLKLVIRKKMI